MGSCLVITALLFVVLMYVGSCLVITALLFVVLMY